MKKYRKPSIDIVVANNTSLLSSSTTSDKPSKNQCDCPQHNMWGGCNGCEGNCPCGGC